MIGGVVPLLMLTGIILLVMAAPSTKERLAEAAELVRSLLGTKRNADDDAREAHSGSVWRTSDADQYSEFYSLIESEEPE